MKRTNVVELVVGKEEHERLKELGVTTAKCWNEVNWLRMQQFKKGERVDFAKSSTFIVIVDHSVSSLLFSSPCRLRELSHSLQGHGEFHWVPSSTSQLLIDFIVAPSN